MLDPINIHIFFAASLPALFYLGIIYFNGKQVISIKAALVYLMLGCLSVSWLEHVIHFIFPNILDMMFLDTKNPILDLRTFGLYYLPTKLSHIFFYFVQVGLKEELIKLSAFAIAFLPRLYFVQNRKDSLFSIMFYSCCVAVGFALVENIAYAQDFLYRKYYTHSEVESIMLLRSGLAVVMHMICGLIIGYGFACAKLSHDWLGKIFNVVFWLLMAAFLHGAYNYTQAFMSSGIDIIILNITIDYYAIEILLMGLVFTYLMGKRMKNLSMENLLRQNEAHQTKKLSNPEE